MALGKAVFGRNIGGGGEEVFSKKIRGARPFFQPKKWGENFFNQKTGRKFLFYQKSGAKFLRLKKGDGNFLFHANFPKTGLRNR